MQFTSVVLNNFLSYAHAEFADIDRSGLTLIEGRNLDEGDSNGSGKSSIWDGISWALFGKTVRGIKDDSVINRKIGKNTRVAVTLMQDSYQYTVTRTRKHDEYKNKLTVEKRGTITRDLKFVELGTIDMTQDWILKEFGVDFDLFRCTVLFGQGETFNFVNESNGEQKKILSKIMKVNFSEQHFKAKALMKEREGELQEAESKIMVLRSHIKDPTTMFKEQIEKWESDRDERLKKVQIEAATLNKRWKALNADLEERPIEKFIEAKNKVKAVVEKYSDKIDKLTQSISDHRARCKVLKDEIRSCEALGAQKSCPVCLGEIDSERGLQRINKAKTEIKEREQAVGSLESERDDLSGKCTGYQSKSEYLSDKIGEQESKARTAEDLLNQIKKIKVRLKDVASEENPFEGKIKEEAERQIKIKEKLEDFKTKVEKIREEQPYYEFWARAFGDDGIKSFIFDLVCSTLTNRANSYLNVLTGGHISVAFDTQKKLKSGETREKFECQVVSDGGQIPYECYSGGEKRRISLAVDMSLADLMSDYHGSKFNMVVFDEQDQYLDNQGRKHYLNLLKKIAKFKRVFVVAHDDQFKAEFDEVITVQKRDGISEVAC